MYKKNQKKTRSGGVLIKGAALATNDGSSTGGKLETLADALAQETQCGCGIECVCYGYLKLRNFNSTTGLYDYRVMYFVDGVATFATEDVAKAEIQGYKDIAGGLKPA
jgi:hypothetical protein